MPYKTNTDLPKDVRKALPSQAETIYRKAFNSAIKQYDKEKTAHQVAWAAVKNEYKKKMARGYVSPPLDVIGLSLVIHTPLCAAVCG